MEGFPIQQAIPLLPAALSFAIMSLDAEEDKAFLTALYLDHRKRLFRYALRLCGSREGAEDAVQNAFLSLIPKAPSLRRMQQEHLTAYLFVTVKNAAYLAHRKEERIARAENRLLAAASGEQDALPMTGYTLEDLMEVLPGLSERDQTLLRMKYFLHETDQDMAQQLGVQSGSVKELVRRARQRLVKRLEGGDSGHGDGPAK